MVLGVSKQGRCAGTGLTPATWAYPCHIRAGTGLAPATSASGLGSPLPHLHRDRLGSRRSVPVRTGPTGRGDGAKARQSIPRRQSGRCRGAPSSHSSATPGPLQHTNVVRYNIPTWSANTYQCRLPPHTNLVRYNIPMWSATTYQCGLPPHTNVVRYDIHSLPACIDEGGMASPQERVGGSVQCMVREATEQRMLLERMRSGGGGEPGGMR